MRSKLQLTLEEKMLRQRTRLRMFGRLMFGVGICLCAATAAHAQSDPFSATATTWETMLTGTFAQMVTVSGIVISGIPLVTGQAGDHKGKLLGTAVGGVIVLAAQRIVSSLLSS